MFDLDQTNALAELFRVPKPTRDDAWTNRFTLAAWTASLVVNAPPAILGPDGFAYLRLNLPQPGAPFDSNCMANLAQSCLDRGSGLAVFASAADPEPQFVFPMGMLDSLVRYDTWRGDPADEAGDPAANRDPVSGLQVTTLSRAHSVLLGTPSADYLPPYTARALLRHLRDGWGWADPRVQLLVDPALRPSRNLVLGRKPSEFEPGTANAMCQRLLWYLPHGRGLMLMMEDGDFASMVRLEELGRPVQ